MADLLHIRGLVAAGVDPTRSGSVRQTQAARRAESVTGRPSVEAAGAADEVNVRPAPAVDLRPREMELRQGAVVSLEARAAALSRVGEALGALRAGTPGAAAELRAEVEGMSGLLETRSNLTRLLAGVDPEGARALDPGLLETAMVETENALAAVFGQLGEERRGLAAARVVVENETAARVELEQLGRAAEQIRRQEERGGPVGMLEALRGQAISRSRVIELLIQ